MAKVKRYNLRPQLWLVKITVSDPNCVFSINPNISYNKIVKASNDNSAVREAAVYCTRKMKEYPGTHFTYSTENVKPYFYPINNFNRQEEDDTGIKRIKI
jgi:hypothetical protein